MAIAELSNKLAVDRYGIWTHSKASSISYPEDGSMLCFEVEDASFWFRHRNDCILSAIKRFIPDGPILDVGGGNGYVTRRILDEGFESALLEPSPTGAFNARTQRRIPEVICSTLEDAGFPPGSLNAVGLFDVLEHIKNDRAFMELVDTILQADGTVYATVPAHQQLWSLSDVYAQHFRRYNRKRIVDLIENRFDLVYFTYFFGALTVPLILMRTLPFKLGVTRKKNILSSKAEHGTSGGLTISILNFLLKREFRKIREGKQLSIGTSCLWVARKKMA